MTDTVALGLAEAYELAFDVLRSNGFSEAHAASIARVIHRGQVDECQSHGLYRVLVCVRTLRAGKVSPEALPKVSHPSPAAVRVDAQGGYSLLAFDTGRPLLVEKVRTNGIAALVINRCYHFSALWPEVEDLAADGVAALCMLPSHGRVANSASGCKLPGSSPAFTLR